MAQMKERTNHLSPLPLNISVMIVDDMPETRSNIRKIPNDPRIRIVGEAVDGDDALRQFHKLLPNVVVMNINMPARNGIEVTEQMCRIKPDVNVIILTVVDSPDYRANAIKAGARDYITKPPLPDELLRSVIRLCSNQREDASTKGRFSDLLENYQPKIDIRSLLEEINEEILGGLGNIWDRNSTPSIEPLPGWFMVEEKAKEFLQNNIIRKQLCDDLLNKYKDTQQDWTLHYSTRGGFCLLRIIQEKRGDCLFYALVSDKVMRSESNADNIYTSLHSFVKLWLEAGLYEVLQQPYYSQAEHDQDDEARGEQDLLDDANSFRSEMRSLGLNDDDFEGRD
jgi:DNA-binding NarL/FixJ family response regulator